MTTGGSPGESFRFVAPATGTYAFSLDGDFDGAWRSSMARVALSDATTTVTE